MYLCETHPTAHNLSPTSLLITLTVCVAGATKQPDIQTQTGCYFGPGAWAQWNRLYHPCCYPMLLYVNIALYITHTAPYHQRHSVLPHTGLCHPWPQYYPIRLYITHVALYYPILICVTHDSQYYPIGSMSPIALYITPYCSVSPTLLCITTILLYITHSSLYYPILICVTHDSQYYPIRLYVTIALYITPYCSVSPTLLCITPYCSKSPMSLYITPYCSVSPTPLCITPCWSTLSHVALCPRHSILQCCSILPGLHWITSQHSIFPHAPLYIPHCSIFPHTHNCYWTPPPCTISTHTLSGAHTYNCKVQHESVCALTLTGKKERKSDCGEWQWSVCVANEGDCGLGTREGTRTGTDCKQTIKTQRCKIPCNWKKAVWRWEATQTLVTHSHTHTHARTHACTHAHRHAHTHTHTHTPHTYNNNWLLTLTLTHTHRTTPHTHTHHTRTHTQGSG